MSTVFLQGVNLSDVIFTTDKKIFGVEICWNVTRIQRDADAGAFGRPTSIAMSRLPPMSDLHESNVDWDKIAGMISGYRNDPSTSILLKPALQVIVQVEETTYRIPVDGNHRICARRILGLENFESHVVPLAMERKYRVIETMVL